MHIRTDLGRIIRHPMNLPSNYQSFINDLKTHIGTSRFKAGLSVNRELILMYWHIGNEIIKRQKEEGWGTKVINQISMDLRHEFPEMRGFSPRNLVYMQTFARAYPDYEFTQAVPAQITWYHNTTLLDKVSDSQERQWYIEKTIENGWSRNVLVHQIETNLHERQGQALTNFRDTLPAPQSELAQEVLKNPYDLKFLPLSSEAQERDIENALIVQLKDFLLELGTGFAFLGNQYHVELEGQDYYMDLLFYHVKLKCYLVIELKKTEFKPEYAGKLNFYLNLIDRQIRDENDNQTIGLLLCSDKKEITVEYAIEGLNKPIGVSSFKLTEKLPNKLKDLLPSSKELKRKLREKEKDGLAQDDKAA